MPAKPKGDELITLEPGHRYHIHRRYKRAFETIDVLEALDNGIYHVILDGRHMWIKLNDITNYSEVKI